MIPLRKLTDIPRPLLSPDEFGFLIALDKDLRDRMHSGPDGIPYEVSRQLTNAIGGLQMGPPPALSAEAYFKQLADMLARHNIEPFKGKSMAVVGFYDPLHKSTLRRIDARLLPKQLFDIAPETTGGRLLTPENALALTDNAKVNYLITGNVVNAPNFDLLRNGQAHNNTNPVDVIRASAILLKQGGYAIHLCGYGGDPNALAPLQNEALFAQLGQVMQHVHAPRSDFEAIVLQQERELAAAPQPAITDQRFISTGTMITDPPGPAIGPGGS